MQIHVARQSSQLGIFSAEEITAGLQSGRFLPTDLGWRDGMASWLALGEWPEFRGAATPSVAGAVVDSGVTTIPWEQGKSAGSFFATAFAVIRSPRETLAQGRYAFGDWLVFCYWALLVSLPFQLAGTYLGRDMNAELGRWLTDSGVPFLVQMGESMLKQPVAPFWAMALGLVFGLAFAPLIYALFGCIHWVGQKAFRLSIPVERTVSATLLACASLIVVTAPLQLLRFSLLAQLIMSILLVVPLCIVYYRALGVATGVSAGKQFLISCAVWFVLFCCFCALPGMLLAMLGNGAAIAR